MRCVKVIAVASLAFALTSCTYIYGEKGFIQNRDTHYLRAYSTPPLIIPPCLSSSTIEAHYPVAQREYPQCAKRVNLTPPELLPSQPVVREYAPASKSKMAPEYESTEPVESEPASGRPSSPQTEPQLQPRKAESADANRARQQAHNLAFKPNYYFDQHTRSSPPPSKIVQSAPVMMKTQPALTTPKAVAAQQQTSTHAETALTTPKAIAAKPQTNTQTETSLTAPNAIAAKPQTSTQTETENPQQPIQQAQNSAKNTAPKPFTIPNSFTDRFSHH